MRLLFVFFFALLVSFVISCAIEKISPSGARTVYSIYDGPKPDPIKHKHKVCDPPDLNGIQRCTYYTGEVFYLKPKYPTDP